MANAPFHPGRTYGDTPREKIERFIDAPMFPTWCDLMERRMREATARMQDQLDAAIRRDIEAMKERKRR
jgi:hypothetical protein